MKRSLNSAGNGLVTCGAIVMCVAAAFLILNLVNWGLNDYKHREDKARINAELASGGIAEVYHDPDSPSPVDNGIVAFLMLTGPIALWLGLGLEKLTSAKTIKLTGTVKEIRPPREGDLFYYVRMREHPNKVFMTQSGPASFVDLGSRVEMGYSEWDEDYGSVRIQSFKYLDDGFPQHR